MTLHANGTDAKDIAVHFVQITGERATPHIMKKTVQQAKTLLTSGYTKEEVISTIDHLVSKGVNMFSLGYVSASINNVLRELEAQAKQQEVAKAKEELASQMSQPTNEVINDDESKERNRDKAKRLGIQSRVREKFNFDMFEE